MRYNTYQNGKIHIIVDTDEKAFIAEVYEQEIAQKIVNALNGLQIDVKEPQSIPPVEITPPETPTHNPSLSLNDQNLGEDAPEYWKTGIKNIGGVDHYKCFYKCFNCNNQGKHYIPKDVRHIFCHECNFELPVTTATSQGFPHRDDFGNYFVSKHTGDNKLVKTWKTVDR